MKSCSIKVDINHHCHAELVTSLDCSGHQVYEWVLVAWCQISCILAFLCVCVVDMKRAVVRYVRNSHLNWLLVLISCIKMLHSVCRVKCFMQKLFHAKCEGVMVLRKEEIFCACGWHCIEGFLLLIRSFLLGGWLWLQSVARGQCPPAVPRGVVSGAAVWGRPRLQRTHETDGSYSPASSPLAVSLCLVTVPVCVYVCVCVCVCVGGCVHACVHVRAHACVCVWVHVCVVCVCGYGVNEVCGWWVGRGGWVVWIKCVCVCVCVCMRCMPNKIKNL